MLDYTVYEYSIVTAMNETPPESSSNVSLEQLLLRDDMWMGHSQRFTARAAVPTGHEDLDSALLNEGWPLSSLVEVCQAHSQAEWRLFTPALLEVPGLIVLLNPPAVPFCHALVQAGIDLERVVVVKAANKAHFIACFIELARASVGALLSWQPDDVLTYTELRKCQLAASESTGLSFMFRSSSAQQQNSPAILRIFAQIIPAGLQLTVFKQRGYLQTQQAKPVVVELPKRWKPVRPYSALYQIPTPDKQTNKPPRLASVTPLRGKS